jgi:hypothetical protein
MGHIRRTKSLDGLDVLLVIHGRVPAKEYNGYNLAVQQNGSIRRRVISTTALTRVVPSRTRF